MGAPELKVASALDLETSIKAALDEHRYVIRAYVVNGDERAVPFILGLVYHALGAVNYPLPTPSVAESAVHREIMSRVSGPMANMAIIRRSAPRATPEMLAELREIKTKFEDQIATDLAEDAPKLEAIAREWEPATALPEVASGLSPIRALVYDFLSLPYVRRIEIVKKLGLLKPGEPVPDHPADFKLCFERLSTDEGRAGLRVAVDEAVKDLHRD